MPLDIPNLDDRRYADLVDEALALIPAHAPEWTNHNPSDPGITLVELFAYLTEMLIYRLNRVTEANQRAFLQLLNGKDTNWTYHENKTLNRNIQDMVLKLRNEERAVTVNDFERLALAAINDDNTRAYCLPRWGLDVYDLRLMTVEKLDDIVNEGQNLVIVAQVGKVGNDWQLHIRIFDGSGNKILDKQEKDLQDTKIITVTDFKSSISSLFGNSNPLYQQKQEIIQNATSISGSPDLDSKQRKEGHISVIVVPASDDLIKKVKDDLTPRCLITTRLHVTAPSYLGLRVQIRLKINPDALENVVLNSALAALNQYFDPITGGAQGTGWPPGQNVYVSDIYALLDKLPGVDYVEKFLVKKENPGEETKYDPVDEFVPTDPARRLPEPADKQLVGVRLEPYELFQFQASADDIQIDRNIENNRKR